MKKTWKFSRTWCCSNWQMTGVERVQGKPPFHLKYSCQSEWSKYTRDWNKRVRNKVIFSTCCHEDLLAVKWPTSPLEQQRERAKSIDKRARSFWKRDSVEDKKSKTKVRNEKVPTNFYIGTSWSMSTEYSKCLHCAYGRFVDLARQHALLVEWELFQNSKTASDKAERWPLTT